MRAVGIDLLEFLIDARPSFKSYLNPETLLGSEGFAVSKLHIEINSRQTLLISFLYLLRFISSLPLTLKGSQCKLIQETLIGDPPTYVASFGNSDVNSVGHWVKILNTRPANDVKRH